ncbi:hypothetical protein SCHPADRAFT_896805 [Schizopora paradoxa]|uniref:Uncharacterized protein n=1 Tax=Schizopora paradoxa TaxID=27342 RepID=A0A0H2QYU6_9AGAM|nr:hypothetical protein SCHPADRAFT_896805 [Schizopora paradoxa]
MTKIELCKEEWHLSHMVVVSQMPVNYGIICFDNLEQDDIEFAMKEGEAGGSLYLFLISQQCFEVVDCPLLPAPILTSLQQQNVKMHPRHNETGMLIVYDPEKLDTPLKCPAEKCTMIFWFWDFMQTHVNLVHCDIMILNIDDFYIIIYGVDGQFKCPVLGCKRLCVDKTRLCGHVKKFLDHKSNEFYSTIQFAEGFEQKKFDDAEYKAAEASAAAEAASATEAAEIAEAVAEVAAAEAVEEGVGVAAADEVGGVGMVVDGDNDGEQGGAATGEGELVMVDAAEPGVAMVDGQVQAPPVPDSQAQVEEMIIVVPPSPEPIVLKVPATIAEDVKTAPSPAPIIQKKVVHVRSTPKFSELNDSDFELGTAKAPIKLNSTPSDTKSVISLSSSSIPLKHVWKRAPSVIELSSDREHGGDNVAQFVDDLHATPVSNDSYESSFINDGDKFEGAESGLSPDTSLEAEERDDLPITIGALLTNRKLRRPNMCTWIFSGYSWGIFAINSRVTP